MIEAQKNWLRVHRKKAGLTIDNFVLALSKEYPKKLTSRDVGGWERCEGKYLITLKYDVIANVLNQHLPIDEQVTSECLKSDHEDAIAYCKHKDLCESVTIDAARLKVAFEACEEFFLNQLLLALNAGNDIDLAVKNTVELIRKGNAFDITGPFDHAFNRALSSKVKHVGHYSQIRTIVAAIAQACVIAGINSSNGEKNEVRLNAIWIIRLRLLAEYGHSLNGIDYSNGRYIKDANTRALITKCEIKVKDPWRRFVDLLRMLVEDYDPRWEDSLPPADASRDEFKSFCDLLNPQIARTNRTKELFFHFCDSAYAEPVAPCGANPHLCCD